MLGGILACGFTHAGITPLDVAKCNMQVCFLSCNFFFVFPMLLQGKPCKIHRSLFRSQNSRRRGGLTRYLEGLYAHIHRLLSARNVQIRPLRSFQGLLHEPRWRREC